MSTQNKSLQSGGYLIIELLIYIAVITIITALTFEWAIAYYMANTQRESQEILNVEISGAQLLIIRDVQQAAVNINEWKKHCDNYYIFAVAEGDVGWCVQDGKLLRMQGSYNKAADTWQKCTRALVASNVQSLSIVPSPHCSSGNLVSSCIQTASGKFYECAIHIRNGVSI